ncbi:hypothetical protein BGAL_0583g00040 [Botrytis galanthina]|uniref:Uncharacterized protein n=1 Tax=Botrytis galanthina TaxID=278940 RepID=A0A4S8QMI9_9HELO|nr:hypothetical protein BGAL_0583g00040 [Botrytis galanthina]
MVRKFRSRVGSEKDWNAFSDTASKPTREEKEARKRAVKPQAQMKKTTMLTQNSINTQETEWENSGERSPESQAQKAVLFSTNR